MKPKVISVRNVNGAFNYGLDVLRYDHVKEKSRNGDVWVHPGPVITHYHRPRERVLFHYGRDANPFFHFFESLWMLAGRQDLAFVQQFVKRMREYSDDNKTLQGAYGWRWRNHFGMDQMDEAIHQLREDPNSRRVVITMWDPDRDMQNYTSKDVPCNTHIYVQVINERVHMSVLCRSNDAIWGAYGANAVHFSYLQEFLACGLGLNVGELYQFSNNFHVYPGMPRFQEIWASGYGPDLYHDMVTPGPMLFNTDEFTAWEWAEELNRWLLDPWRGPGTFLGGVAYPMWQAWETRDTEHLNECAAPDWRHACTQWLDRRNTGDGTTNAA